MTTGLFSSACAAPSAPAAGTLSRPGRSTLSRPYLRRWAGRAAAAMLGFGLLAAAPAWAAPNPTVNKTLSAASNPIPSGQAFTYPISWQCPGANSATDSCHNMVIVDPLPETLQATSLPSGDGKLAKVCVQNPGDSLPNYATCTQGSVPTQVGAILHFVFVPTINAGDSGAFDFSARFPAGTTPNGASATNAATISATDAQPVQSTAPPITASATDQTTVTKTIRSNAAVGYNTVYRITVCPKPDNVTTGYLNVGNVTVSDTLPPGAVFVEANPAPSSTSGQVQNWTFADLTACQNIDVTVNYPTDGTGNTAGETKVNRADFIYTPVGGTQSSKYDEETKTLANPNAGVGAGKSASDDVVNPGQTMYYTLTGRNSGNVPLTSLTITDTLPPMCQGTSISNITAGSTACTVTLSDTNTQSCTTALPAGTHITGVTATWANVPVGIDNTRSLRVNCNVVNPAPPDNYTLPATVGNTLTVNGMNGSTPVGPSSTTTTVTLRDPGINSTIQPDATKTKQSPAGNVPPGSNVTFRIGMTNSSNYSSAPEQVAMLDPVFADLLDEGMTYVSATLVGSAPANCTAAPTITPITNYNGTNRTLVVFSWQGASPQCSLARGDAVTYDLVATVGQTTAAGNHTNHVVFLGSSNPAGVARGTEGCSSSAGYLSNFQQGTLNPSNGTADSGRICDAVATDWGVQRIANVESRKGVRGTADAAWLYGPGEPSNVARTVREGDVLWALEINNTANVPLDHIEIIDIVPTADPSSNTGVGTGTGMGSTWGPRFASPIDPAAGGAPAGTKVYYTQAPNPCRPNIVAAAGCNPMTTLADGTPLTDEATQPAPGAAGQWSTVLPTDPSRVRAFRIVYPTAHQVPPGQTLRFVFPMHVPADAPITDCATTASNACSNIAWNTFGFSYHTADNGAPNASAPTRVGVVVQETPDTTASLGDFVWYDTNRDGVQNDDEIHNGVNNVRVELYLNGELVGATTTGNDPETGLPGYYRFAGLTPNTDYQVRFYPPAGYTGSPANAGGDDAKDSDGVETTVDGTTWFQAPAPTGGNGSHNPTIDQGIYQVDEEGNPADPLFSLGNRVWLDVNNDGIDNDGDGSAGSGTGIPGVTVELWAVDAEGNPTGAAPVATQVTNGTGHYLFTDLPAGNYRVVIPPNQAALSNLYSSGEKRNANGTWSEQAHGNNDTNDHGTRSASAIGAIEAGSVVSPVVTLGPAANAPIDEIGTPGPNQTPGYTDLTPDNRSNLTVDFGFYALAVGNQLWYDVNNNGVFDAGEDPVPGALVEVLDAQGNVIGSSVSDANGRWTVTGLPAGDGYTARVSPGAFQSGGPLDGWVSSTWYTSDVTIAGNSIDHGVDSPNPHVTGITSRPFNLGGTLPLEDGQAAEPGTPGDPSDNLTVDFGFTRPGTPQDPNSPIKRPPPAPIPTLSQWGLILLALLMAGFALRRRRM